MWVYYSWSKWFWSLTENEKRHSYKQNLIQHGIITSKQKYICKNCIQFAIDKFQNQTYSWQTGGPWDTSGTCTNDDVSMEIDEENDENLDFPDPQNDNSIDFELLSESTKTEYVNLAFKLGPSIFKSLYSDNLIILKDYQNYDKGQAEWLGERHPLLLSFIEGCTGVSLHDNIQISKKVNSALHAIEQIIHARNLNAICPFSFKRNVVSYTESRSKLCVQLMGAWEPAGGFTSVSQFVSQQRPPAECPPADFHVAIDNNQKVSKSSGRIREGSTVPVGICTAVSFIKPGFDTHLMADENLKPEKWMQAPNADTLESIRNQEAHDTEFFSVQRENFISNELSTVVEEQSVSFRCCVWLCQLVTPSFQ